MKKAEFGQLPMPVQDYLLYLEAIKGHSELSVIEYASDLRTFFRYLAKEKNLYPPDTPDDQMDLRQINMEFIKTITLSDAYQFLIYCKNQRGNAEATRARRVIAIRRFFIYLTDNRHLLEENPMKVLDAPKTKKALPKYMTLEEARHLLSVVDGKHKERDYAILTLLLNCGMRLSELVSIDYNDIKSNDTLVITGKGNKERTVYLNDACKSAVSAYMVYAYLDKAGLGDRGLSVHKLRHTAATLMYQNGHVDLLLLKEILGHENLGTTEIYTHISDDAAKAAIEANPLADLDGLKSRSQN